MLQSPHLLTSFSPLPLHPQSLSARPSSHSYLGITESDTEDDDASFCLVMVLLSISASTSAGTLATREQALIVLTLYHSPSLSTGRTEGCSTQLCFEEQRIPAFCWLVLGFSRTNVFWTAFIFPSLLLSMSFSIPCYSTAFIFTRSPIFCQYHLFIYVNWITCCSYLPPSYHSFSVSGEVISQHTERALFHNCIPLCLQIACHRAGCNSPLV